MSLEHPSATPKRTRGAYSRRICLECHERRIKCELPDDVAVPDPGELRTASSPCYRCKKLGVPCVVRRTRLGRSGLGDGSTTLPAEIQDEMQSLGSYAVDVALSQEGYQAERRNVMAPISQPDCSMNRAKIQILPLRRAAVPTRSPATSAETSSSSGDRPIILKRTRASKPKVRTGCLTCKIRRVCNLPLGVSSLANPSR